MKYIGKLSLPPQLKSSLKLIFYIMNDSISVFHKNIRYLCYVPSFVCIYLVS